jgi:hypothetical protein
MQADFESLFSQLNCIVRSDRSGVYVRSGTDALPIDERTITRVSSPEIKEAAQSAAVTVVISSHNDDCLESIREVPETRQWLLAVVHMQNQIREKTLLYVGLRNCDLA